MEFTVSLVCQPPEALVRVGGELDRSSSPVLRARLSEAIDLGCRRVLLDLAEVDFVDASALGVLTSVRRAFTEAGGSLRFASYQAAFLKVCRVTGLAEHFGLDGTGQVTPELV